MTTELSISLAPDGHFLLRIPSSAGGSHTVRVPVSESGAHIIRRILEARAETAEPQINTPASPTGHIVREWLKNNAPARPQAARPKPRAGLSDADRHFLDTLTFDEEDL